MESNFLVLDQYRKGYQYNDFIGKFYHFPKKYFNLLSQPNIEFVYYEPKKKGHGVYYGYGKINKKPFEDKREPSCYFVEIEDYKPLTVPVPFESEKRPREIPPFYNPQNAVRRIAKENIEGICLDGGIRLSFKADAHLIKVLGEQLIASERVGILELIKNSYDAQASYCKVNIEKVGSLPRISESLYEFNDYHGPVIVVEDDGTGMTKEVIENGWLRPASTLKTNIKERLKREKIKAVITGTLGTYKSLSDQLKKEYKNRIPLGEKGVGRFATHRLGRNLIIKTKVQGLEYEYILKIDWDVFDQISENAIDLDSIGVSLTRQKPSRNYGENDSGTQVIIHGGKEGFAWNERTIRDLNRSIVMLNSPNPNPNKTRNKFHAYLECPQLPDLQEANLWEDFDPAFSFEGLVDENGILDYILKFLPPKSVPMVEDTWTENGFDLKKCDIKYWKNKFDENFGKPVCGTFYLHLDVWYRSKPWLDGPNRNDFTKYLDSFGGISIYRDAINIFPAEWGAEIDWLDIKTRHIKRGKKMSYYNMIGNLEIDQTENLDLIDKTDREGLIENQAYQDLRKLVETILISIIENQFIGKRDKYSALTEDVVRDPKILSDYTRQGAKIVYNIKEKYPLEEDPYIILQELGGTDQRKEKLINLERSLKNLQKSIELIDEQKDLLTEQAGFGLAIAVSVHELAKITSNFYYGVNELLKKGFDEKKLEELRDASSSLRTELKRLSPLRAVRSEKRSAFNITKPIQYAYEVFKRRLNKLNVDFELLSENDFQIYARYGAVIQIFSNLFDNSCYWLETESNISRKFLISVDSKYRTVIAADNGPGIHDSILPYLFQPGYSLKMPPSGLGLYICKYYMQSMRGDIYLSTRKERIPTMKGTQFTLDFGKVPQNKEQGK